MRRTSNTVRAISSRSITRCVSGSRGLLCVLFLVGLVLSACGGGPSGSPGDDGSEDPDQATTGTSGDMEAVATLTIDGEPYTFVGVKGASVVSEDFYCSVGTSGLSGKLALEGDDGSTLRFNFGPSGSDGHVSAVLPEDFESAVRDGGRNQDIELHDFSVTDESFSFSATILMKEDGSGTEYDGTLEVSC